MYDHLDYLRSNNLRATYTFLLNSSNHKTSTLYVPIVLILVYYVCVRIRILTHVQLV